VTSETKTEAKPAASITDGAGVEDKANGETNEGEDAEDGVINMEIFGQIIELDEEGDYEFSWGMVTAYFTQADQTFTEMDKA
jgi:hypothetical protein